MTIKTRIIVIGIIFSVSMGYILWDTLTPTAETPSATPLAQLQKRAQQGEAAAQYQLAAHYFNKGKAVAQDLTQAVNWIRQAAQQNHAQAQYTLAQMYREGKGVKQDSAQAYHWYQQAAENNFLLAQYNLGVMRYRGDGVTQDVLQAYQWFAIVAAQGQKQVEPLITQLKAQLSVTQRAQAEQFVRQWIQKNGHSS
ncbi:MAG: tetratricopeptide repeat protein [Pseudomonadota bacterium]|nr:tetratricopeptide repeat protein [Pseudomonadota bacterium]